jgi:thioesterase DpgC
VTTQRATHKAAAIYEELTDGLRLDLRVTDLVYQAAERYPEVLPTRAEIDAEREHIQSEKQGLEIRQGEFVAEVLADPQLGFHLMHAMSQPRAEALAHIDELRKTGRVDLGPILVERDGAIGRVTIQNHAFLNSEDDVSTAARRHASASATVAFTISPSRTLTPGRSDGCRSTAAWMPSFASVMT